jgi:hypothetical protein
MGVIWAGLSRGAPLALLQHAYGGGDWWFYLLAFAAMVLSGLLRGRYGGWRYRDGGGWIGGGWGWGSGWGNSGLWGPNNYANPYGAQARLTPPPMPDPSHLAADQYQTQLNLWLGARGLDPNNPQHVRMAIEANPYTPPVATTPPTADFGALGGGGGGFGPLASVTAAPAAGPDGPRHYPPQQMQELLWLYGKPWWVAGGWALDLWQGRPTRPHQDVEIAIPRADQLALRSFLGQFRFTQVTQSAAGAAELPLGANELVEAPRHELHARRITGAGAEALPLLHFEALLNEIDGGVWHYRRDQRISLPVERLGGTSADGIPFLAPEVVLLYKAGLWQDGAPVAAKDDADFHAALPALPAQTRYWLREAIATAHPGHPWLLELDTPVFGN